MLDNTPIAKQLSTFKLPNYNWNERKVIGNSSHSTTFKVKNSKTGEYVAIKQFKLPTCMTGWENFHDQFNKLKKIKNEHIVQYIDDQIEEIGGYIVMQLCQCNLRDYLKKYQWKMPEQVSKVIIKHMVEAICVLRSFHCYNVYYNPNNFLVKGRSVKLSPIGIGKLEVNFQQSMVSAAPLYMAPEVIKENSLRYHEKTERAEVWSVGVIAYELIMGTLPFSYQSWQTYKTNLSSQNVLIPESTQISEITKDFLNKCLVSDRDNRLSWQQLLCHPLMKQKLADQIPKRFTPQMVKVWKKLKSQRQKYQSSFLSQLKDEEDKYVTLEKFIEICKTQMVHINIKQVTEIFREFDKDKSNRLEAKELNYIFKQFNIHEDNEFAFMRDLAQAARRNNINIYKISENYDQDKSNTLDSAQLKNLIRSLLPESSNAMIQKVWDHLHQKHKGKITTKKMRDQLLIYLPTQAEDLHFRARTAFMEFKETITKNGITPSNLIKYFDINNDKKLSLQQFKPMFNSIIKFQRQEELRIIFGLIDKDNSGYITLSQIRELWNKTV